ncbi:MAG: hypothetical protein ACLGQH_09470, partial [Acidobacteriota bacterium]
MHESQLNSTTKSYGLSLGIASILSALLVLAKETNEGLLNAMKQVTVHHWVTHVVFLVATFLILGFALNKSRDGQGPAISDGALLRTVIGSVVLSTVIIVVFY